MVVEVPFQPRIADLMPASFQDAFGFGLPAVRSWRARYSPNGMDAAQTADTVPGTDPTIDRYLLELGPAAADVVVRQTSDIAAYWHSEARALRR